MRFRLLILAFTLVLFSSTIYSAYFDYGITDVIAPQSVDSNSNLDVNILVSNNSLVDAAVDLNIDVVTPNGGLISSQVSGILVSANDINNYFISLTSDLNASPHPYILRITIDENDSYLVNNTFTKYFTVRKVSKKIPVPEMPVYFGLFIALLVVFFIADKKIIKNKKNK